MTDSFVVFRNRQSGKYLFRSQKLAISVNTFCIMSVVHPVGTFLNIGCAAHAVKILEKKIKWDVSSCWSFSLITAKGSKQTKITQKTHPTLL